MILLSKNISNTSSSSSSTSSGLSNEAIITITIFILLACCFLSSAVYLLIKGKNISDIFEETIEDDDCGSCIGFMNDSRHSDNNNNNILQDTVRFSLLSPLIFFLSFLSFFFVVF